MYVESGAPAVGSDDGRQAEQTLVSVGNAAARWGFGEGGEGRGKASGEFSPSATTLISFIFAKFY
jgi:hypothetical protein